MPSPLQPMTGEELLLMAVLGDSEAKAAMDRELDRRALSGPSLRERRPLTVPAEVRADLAA